MEPAVYGTRNKFVCTFCFKSFSHKCYLDRHVRKHTGERPYPCNLCSYRAGRRDNLDLHMGAKHGIHIKRRPWIQKFKDNSMGSF